MYGSTRQGRHVFSLTDAFKNDGFEAKKIITRFNRVGIAAESKTAINYDTGLKKKAYYLEGTNYEIGYLLGCLAENDISSMAVEFTDKIVFSFIGSKLLEKIKLLQEAFIHVVYELSKRTFAELPQEIRDEIQGVYDGCKSSNPYTKVSLEHLIVLNIGIDVLCSMIYTGNFFPRDIPGLKPEDLKIPIMCNAFSVFGNSAGYGHFFCRDFMFPTAGVFQNTAAMIIYNPVDKTGRKVFPFISVTAPGMVGSISAMNINGAGIGVDMSPAANCDPGQVGTNSLLMSHMCAQYGDSAEHMVEIMKGIKRGVSWNYIISDGIHDRACVVEAGNSGNNPDFTQFPPEDFRKILPDSNFIYANRSAELQNGLMVRWNDYNYPAGYLNYNRGLWNHYNKVNSTNKQIYPDAFSENGYINKNHGDKNCPSAIYFAPQRENNTNLVIATNHFIIPEMRYYAMHPWTAKIAGDNLNDIQWRYDELNYQIWEVLKEKGSIDYETAKRLISFLSPYGKNPSYYAGNPKSKNGRETRIEGCTSVFDLKKKTAESHYGYFCDEWVKLTLPNYIYN